ncbi:MAG: ExeA family protein [bacterium]
MCYEFYGLQEAPFTLNPDPRFLFLSENHKGALLHLQHRLAQGDGFMVLLGDAGTGKTTILRTLLRSLSNDVRIAFITLRIPSFRDLLINLCHDFGLDYHGETPELLLALGDFLRRNAQEGKKALLILDESHHLKNKLLEEIRLLSNYETDQSKLLQILFAGQTELEKRLRRPELKQLRERITLQYALRPLHREDTMRYIRWRLQIAGAPEQENIFSPEAVEAIYECTNGVPRLINRMCDNALLLGYMLQARSINATIVHKAELRSSFNDESTRFEIRAPGWVGLSPANGKSQHGAKRHSLQTRSGELDATIEDHRSAILASAGEPVRNGKFFMEKLSQFLRNPFNFIKG